jgi:hypothetical protein
MVHITLHLCLLRRAKPKSPVILPGRAPAPQKQNKGVSIHLSLINRQVRGSCHGRQKKIKASETKAHGHRFTYCFFVTASFGLIPFYRIQWLVVIDLVVSRFRLWFIVALPPALFRWPCLVSLAMAPVSSHPPPPCHVRIVPRLPLSIVCRPRACCTDLFDEE